MISLKRVRQVLQTGLERPHDGVHTSTRLAVAYGVPGVVAALTFWTNPRFNGDGLLAGEAILTGALFALAVLGYDRVRDLAETEPWDGIDPMQAAVRFAKAALAAAYLSIAVSGLLVLMIVVDLPDSYERCAQMVLAGLLVHQFIRLWLLVGALRHQIGATAGRRAGAS